MGTVVTSGSLGGVIISTLVQNVRDTGLILVLGTIFPIFITPITLVAMTMMLYKLCAVWLLNLPFMYIFKMTARMYVIVSIKTLTIIGRQV